MKQLAKAKPDVIYVATYYPEGGLIAKEMLAGEGDGEVPGRLRLLRLRIRQGRGQGCRANCPVVEVPAPERVPRRRHPRQRAHGVRDRARTWSPYTYDSVNLLADAAKQAGGFDLP